ncbi:MAG TPA: response regulator transcription factor [Candidatus Merdenecus merdavium]|nr:response regulator transcription factor [Candidatus Merdenecus merdavium]
MIHILVVEDDFHIRRLLQDILLDENYIPVLAEDAQKALDILDRQHIDLMITDIMMPGMDGYSLTRQLRDSGYDFPILMITAKETIQDKREGFNIGADDYMVKPVDGEELILRVKALLRRAKIVNERKIILGKVSLNYDSLTVSRDMERITLPQKEFFLLYKLLSYPNTIFTRMQLMDEIWGYDSQTDEHTVSVHISRLRERFGDWPEFDIITVRGLGYKAVKYEDL